MSSPKDDRPFTEVAVGVVFDATGRVLMAQRPQGKAYAGWWEFPGGKIEPGETVAQALARELAEELDLTVAESFPWVVREHSYEHARVRLHFHRIFDASGDPRALEQQAFTWQDPKAIGVQPLLPAALPLLPWLSLPTEFRQGVTNLAKTAPNVVICSSLEEIRSETVRSADLILLNMGPDWQRAIGLLPAPGYVPLGTPGANARIVQGFWA